MTLPLPDDPTPAEFIDWLVEAIGAENIDDAGTRLAFPLGMTEQKATRYLYRWRNASRGPTLASTLRLLRATGLLATGDRAQGVAPLTELAIAQAIEQVTAVLERLLLHADEQGQPRAGGKPRGTEATQ